MVAAPQGGNNNTYCHDSELNWLDWGACAQDSSGFARFMRHLIAFRSRTPSLGALLGCCCCLARHGQGGLRSNSRAPPEWCGQMPRRLAACRRKRVELRRASYSQGGSIQFHALGGGSPEWDDDSRFVGLTLGAPEGGLYIAFNSSHEAVVATLPDWPGRLWQPLIDTGKVSPARLLQEAHSASRLGAARACPATGQQCICSHKASLLLLRRGSSQAASAGMPTACLTWPDPSWPASAVTSWSCRPPPSTSCRPMTGCSPTSWKWPGLLLACGPRACSVPCCPTLPSSSSLWRTFRPQQAAETPWQSLPRSAANAVKRMIQGEVPPAGKPGCSMHEAHVLC